MANIKALENWTELNKKINSFSLKGLIVLLDQEKNGSNRRSFVRRIHQKITRMRGVQEREKLMRNSK